MAGNAGIDVGVSVGTGVSVGVGATVGGTVGWLAMFTAVGPQAVSSTIQVTHRSTFLIAFPPKKFGLALLAQFNHKSSFSLLS